MRDALPPPARVGVAVAVHEHDGDAAGPGRTRPTGRAGALRPAAALLRRQAFPAPAPRPHFRVQQLGQLDVAVKQAWPVLVSDAQRIAKPGGDQQGGLALALQQRWRWWPPWCPSSRTPTCDGVTAHRLQARVADARRRRILVLLGVLLSSLWVTSNRPGRLATMSVKCRRGRSRTASGNLAWGSGRGGTLSCMVRLVNVGSSTSTKMLLASFPTDRTHSGRISPHALQLGLEVGGNAVHLHAPSAEFVGGAGRVHPGSWPAAGLGLWADLSTRLLGGGLGVKRAVHEHDVLGDQALISW